VSKRLTSIICGLACLSCAAPFCCSQEPCANHLESQSFTCESSTCSSRITTYVPNIETPNAFNIRALQKAAVVNFSQHARTTGHAEIFFCRAPKCGRG
jgi:hypothetical protein